MVEVPKQTPRGWGWLKLDHCASNPCQNRGICKSYGYRLTGGFTCDCSQTGYKGETCDTSSKVFVFYKNNGFFFMMYFVRQRCTLRTQDSEKKQEEDDIKKKGKKPGKGKIQDS